MRTITLPIFESISDALNNGYVIIVEDKDTYHRRIRCIKPFYLEHLKSVYSEGEVIQFTKYETQSGIAHREAEERRYFMELLVDLTKCRTCGVYDCTQHSTTAKELLNKKKIY